VINTIQRLPYIDDETLTEHQNFISKCREKSLLSFTKIMQLENSKNDKNVKRIANNTDKSDLNVTNVNRFDLFDNVMNDVIHHNKKNEIKLIEQLNGNNENKIEKVNLMELFPIDKLKNLIDIQIGELENSKNDENLPLRISDNKNIQNTYDSNRLNGYEKQHNYEYRKNKNRANFISKNAIANFFEEMASNCENESNVTDLLSYLDLFLSHSKPPPPASSSNGRWAFIGIYIYVCMYVCVYVCINIYLYTCMYIYVNFQMNI
jgi:hypothetical protein